MEKVPKLMLKLSRPPPGTFVKAGAGRLLKSHETITAGSSLVVAAAAWSLCAVPVLLGFVLPVAWLTHMLWQEAAQSEFGLPLARSIMELHQGGLEIASELGVGTSVAIWLPRKVCLASAGGV